MHMVGQVCQSLNKRMHAGMHNVKVRLPTSAMLLPQQ